MAHLNRYGTSIAVSIQTSEFVTDYVSPYPLPRGKEGLGEGESKVAVDY